MERKKDFTFLVIPVLGGWAGGPEVVRVVLNSSSTAAPVLGGPEVVRAVLNSSSTAAPVLGAPDVVRCVQGLC